MNKLSNHSLLDMDTVNKLYKQLESQPLEESSKQLIDELKQMIFPYIQSQQDLVHSLSHVMSVTMTDENGSIKSTDDYFCSLANYEMNEVIGEEFTYFLSSSTNDSFFYYWNNRDHSRVFDDELCYLTKANTLFWMRTIVVPIDDGQSSIIFGMDVTNQKHEETKQLEQAHEDYSRTVQSLVNLVFKVVRNKEGHFLIPCLKGNWRQISD